VTDTDAPHGAQRTIMRHDLGDEQLTGAVAIGDSPRQEKTVEPIVIETQDGEMILITSGKSPVIHINDPHVRPGGRVEVVVNGVGCSPDSL
jgi:hypothetical protein